MKKIILLSVLPLGIFLAGCSSAFWGGAAGGAVGAGAGYEYNAKRELDRVEEDYKAGRINQQEYEARKNEIQRMSITQ